MQFFSQRNGLKAASEVIQTGSMKESLRNSIWNVMDSCAWSYPGFLLPTSSSGPAKMQAFSRTLWADFFKLPVDTRPGTSMETLRLIREFYFAAAWNEIYDFVEFVIRPEVRMPVFLPERLNRVLERECSAYRIVGKVVVDITSEAEVEMLDQALRDKTFKGVSAHLSRALELLANRENPDYRNSIKESISAIESMAKIVANDQKATLATALKALEKNDQMHTALKDGFLKIYGYTNDENGIRHAMLEEPTLTAADAKFFLMSCTSFVNYLKAQLPN